MRRIYLNVTAKVVIDSEPELSPLEVCDYLKANFFLKYPHTLLGQVVNADITNSTIEDVEWNSPSKKRGVPPNLP